MGDLRIIRKHTHTHTHTNTVPFRPLGPLMHLRDVFTGRGCTCMYSVFVCMSCIIQTKRKSQEGFVIDETTA